MKTTGSNAALVAYCGLYCGTCGRYLKDKCPGCRENVKASWCKIRSCGIDNGYSTCAECSEFKDVNDCKKFNNIFSKFFSVVFRSDRRASIDYIRKYGTGKYIEKMTAENAMCFKR